MGSKRWIVALAATVVTTLAACEPAPPPPEEGSVLVGCDQAGARVTITQTSHLDPSCVYAGIDITASNVTLDCQDALIRGEQVSGSRGITIVSPRDVAQHDVTVRNCRVEGFLNSLRVTRDGFRTLQPHEEYDHTTARIVIEDSHFSGSRGVGIFVDGYVSDVTIRRNVVTGTGSSGIYLETGSRRSKVIGNQILDNGYRENGPSGQVHTLAGTPFYFWGIGREGVSIDGSYENEIRDNIFARNSAGGIFLYKNCGEYPDRPAYFERRYPSDRNVIEGNVFVGGTNGVWVGSRMGENTFPMDCTDPAYVSDGGLVRVVEDYASDNRIAGNTFWEVTHGIRVEDDDNVVEANRFLGSGPQQHAILVGTPHRSAALGRPVVGTVLKDNVSEIEGNPNPYRWVPGEQGTVLDGNTALGEPVGWCAAPPIPRGPFVFVIAVALAGPGGTPPATTPDLTQPALAAQPPCPG